MQVVRLAIAAVALFGGSQCVLAQVDWPDFRGPQFQGIVPTTSAPLSWSEDENIAWKVDVPGKGWSTPVVIGNQIWLTTAHEVAASEEVRAQRTAGNPVANSLALADKLSLHVMCFARDTGEQLADIPVFDIDEPDPVHSLNSYASPSPVAEPGRVYVHFGQYGTAAIDVDSREVLWRRTFEIDHYVGPGSSPVLAGNVLIVPCDGADKQFVVAVDKATGKTVWQKDRPPMRATDGDFRKSFATPLVTTIAGREQAIVPGSQWIVSYEPATGEELWRLDHGDGFSLVPRPVTNDKFVYCCTGFGRPTMIKIDPSGEGDVSKSHLKWRIDSNIPAQPSPVLVDDQLFIVSDTGVAQCIDAESGESLWKRRLGGNYSASPFVVGDEVLFVSREGVTSVVPADGTDKILRRNELEATLMATPVVLDDSVLIRAEKHLYLVK